MKIGGLPRFRALALLIALAALWAGIFPDRPAPQAPELPSDRMLERVRFLSGDALQGRGIGSRGLRVAAEYIAGAFAACGLQPAGDGGTFYQEFSAGGTPKLGSRNRLEVRSSEGEPWELRLDQDWRPLFFSASGRVQGPAVFVGYGVSDPKNRIDDYAGVDLRGKIAIALRYEPDRKPATGSRPAKLTIQSDLRFKAAAASDRGAVALVIVSGPRKEDPELPSVEEGWALGSASMPVVMVRREAILPKLGPALRRALRPAKGSARPKARPLSGVEVELETDLARQVVRLRNVLAVRPGRGSRAIVIGAHYDHLGLGGGESLAEKPGQIHPGADDNASGTALLLELACALAAEGLGSQAPSLLFVAFAGEEHGLLGSSYYVKNPPLPLANTLAMVNLDMVGRLRNRRLIAFGTATAREFRPFLARISRELGITVASHGDGYGPSDHTPFAAEKIPVLHFFTGAHDDYHRPTDTWEKINSAGMATVGQVVAEMVRLIANRAAPLTPGPPQPPPKPVGGAGYGAYLGIIPDFSRGSGGVLLAGVREGSPASKGGLQKGDVLTQLGAIKVDDLYDLTYALRTYQPGETVSIGFIRSGRRRSCEAKLAAR